MRSLKVLSAGSTLYGMKPAAEAFTRETGIAVKVATDHGHNIHKFALEGTTDADVVLVPSDWSRELVATGAISLSVWVFVIFFGRWIGFTLH